MHNPRYESLSGDLLDDTPQPWWGSALTPDEKVVWVGRPNSRLDFAMKEIVVGLVGLGCVVFTLFWMVGVIRIGGNWDRGQIVSPFESHNVLIAAAAGLVMLPYGLVMLTAPLRAWLNAANTSYVLTTRRAMVRQPSAAGKPNLREFLACDLRGMRCVAQGDGTGDLILGTQPIMGSWWWTKPVGFLAVADVRGVESLARTILGAV